MLKEINISQFFLFILFIYLFIFFKADSCTMRSTIYPVCFRLVVATVNLKEKQSLFPQSEKQRSDN